MVMQTPQPDSERSSGERVPDRAAREDQERTQRSQEGESQSQEQQEVTGLPEGVVIVDEKLKERQKEYNAEAAAAAKVVAKEEFEASGVTPVHIERAAPQVLTYASARERIRILYLTTDRRVYEDGTETNRRILEFASMFAEVHVIVLEAGRPEVRQTERIGEALWLYQARAGSWWRTPFAASRVARRELAFGGVFRPDLIIADNPFEAGFAGALLSGRYDRPLQVHVTTDFLDPTFAKRSWRAQIRRWMAGYAMHRAACARTRSEYLRERIVERYKKLRERVEVLPVFYDIEAWRAAAPVEDLRTKYPEFRFHIFHASPMTFEAAAGEVVDGLYYLLRQYPTIGLVIAGDGPARAGLVDTIARYELSRQIHIVSPDADVLSLVKTADAVIHTSAEPVLDRVALQAAIAEVPLVCGNRGLASELFIDEESMLMCPIDSPPCFGQKINRLLNDIVLRRQIAKAAREEVESRVKQDYPAYLRAYRASIEGCLVGEDAGESAVT
jgi:glycosyltransferase involved in cell wall biosynthesis